MVMAGWLTLAAADSQVSCIVKQAPRVIVTPSKSTIKYDFTKTREQLRAFDIDTVSPYDAKSETHVGGLMSGEIQMESRINFLKETYQPIDRHCLYIDTVEVKLHINPTIFVAKNYKRGSCEHEAILDHEKKHISVDRLIVNKYAQRIADTLSFALNKYGAAYGPYGRGELETAQGKLQSYIETIIKDESDRMNAERREKQQAVDTLEEYERIRKVCE